MDTLDSITNRPDGALSSPAARRNIEPILKVLKAHLGVNARVLEIASGSGEHAVAFADALPGVSWTPSDPSPKARASIDVWRLAVAPDAVGAPVALDAMDPATWPDGPFDVIFCANMTHISPWAATEGLMALAGRVLTRPGGLLALYGPYRETGRPLAPSNAAFDDSLKSRDPAWGLREREAVETLARGHRLAAALRVEMPANNLMLLFRAV